jgi:glycosyltransferase involved in cell wall biosynthesis
MDKNINKNPPVCVVMPVYNRSKYIRQSIESVLQQTFSDFEFLIINDGSTDGSLEIIKSFNDPRIKIVDQENKGLISTLNIGIALSNTKYIARADPDDIWSDRNKLAKQMEYLSKNPDYVLLGTWAKVVDENDKEISRLTQPENDLKIRSRMLTRCCFIHSSVVFSKEAYSKANGYSEQEKYAEDYGLWLRMGRFGKFANIPEYLVTYRVHQEGVSQQKNFAQSKKSFEIIRKYKSLYPNYLRGYLKWNLKLLLLRLIGSENFNRLKR